MKLPIIKQLNLFIQQNDVSTKPLNVAEVPSYKTRNLVDAYTHVQEKNDQICPEKELGI